MLEKTFAYWGKTQKKPERFFNIYLCELSGIALELSNVKNKTMLLYSHFRETQKINLMVNPLKYNFIFLWYRTLSILFATLVLIHRLQGLSQKMFRKQFQIAA